jgi:alpha-galactosidase
MIDMLAAPCGIRFHMIRSRTLCAAILALALSPAVPLLDAQTDANVAPTPPMGWNSWDAYGLTIDEADFKANTTVLAGMKQFGWTYSVIDEGWYMGDPTAKSIADRKYLWDANGNLIPVLSRFPSSANGAGFKPLADWVHAQGLKFGIHIVRGIPREVVQQNLPIAGTSFHASDAADINDKCPWDEGNFGVMDNAAGQAWYDGMLKLYAGWGLDYIKVDCISDHPYRPTEIRQIADAIRKTGRPIVLSLSPGPTKLDNADYVSKYAQMWRITDDHWDSWIFHQKAANSEFPFSTKDEFDRIAQWAPYVKPGNWPDPDMLPLGWLGPHPGWGDARQSRLTPTEERTEFTLWAVSRSPLIFGGNLTKLDDLNRALMTNKELLDIDQNSVRSTPVPVPQKDGQPVPWRAWVAQTREPRRNTYIAVFNPSDDPGNWDLPWTTFQLSNQPQAFFYLFAHAHIPPSASLHVQLPAHGSVVFRVE